MPITRRQVLAYRAAAQGLHRTATSADELAVLDIGVQDSGPDAARLAFDARLATTPPADGIGPGEPLALLWSLRGAPHVHRRTDLGALAGALYPLSEADAAGRLNETGKSVARAGIPALEQYAIAVRELAAVVRRPTAKGTASTAVTMRIPPVMWRDCRPCRAQHISDSAMRSAALAARLELQPGTSPPVLQPSSRRRPANRPDLPALRRMIRAYLWMLGPATPADVAGYLDCRRSDLASVWPDDLVEVSVDGHAGWLAADRVDDLRSPPEPELVRLLGGFDPWMQARDRGLIVPDASVHKALWPVLGRPGVVLVDGEIAGLWRTKAAGRRLTLAVETFGPQSPSTWARVEAEAERVGAVRGATTVTITR